LEPKEEKGQEIKFAPDYKASEPIFWHAFKELNDFIFFYFSPKSFIS
jgi:hypothetical protein